MNTQQASALFAPPPVPFITKEHYASLTGLSINAVNTQVTRGQLPVYSPQGLGTGERCKKYIDMYALHAIAIKRINENPELTGA